MKSLITTLVSLFLFTALGGALLLSAPRLFQDEAPAPLFTEILAPSLTPARGPQQFTTPDRYAAHLIDREGGIRRWWGLGPDPGNGPAPVVLLLHGSEHDGRAMLAMWEETARRHGLILVAPDAFDPAGWSARDGRAFLEAVLADAARLYPADPNRVYIAGHSAGADFALSLVADPPGRARAVAVHAGARMPSGTAKSPVPVRIYLGDNDHLCPLAEARASARALAAAGHRTELVVIPGHDHWFYSAGPAIAADSWAFFQEH
ncbi:alpha/beta hydrolase family esterase [Pseudogemmobacter humi]|uniref:Alpha/beta hydrolase family protein n=1 Tax=Pseudogemmobacter humi TaxID=2483812 RepID=A0A3P5WM08_9RHOB|nr:dienelactone hydrolase family protein [Pseudogemmobacter humi]VDC20380.1 Alpha/beta hydrolase family protein [Pseudogemmobacter humi]